MIGRRGQGRRARRCPSTPPRSTRRSRKFSCSATSGRSSPPRTSSSSGRALVEELCAIEESPWRDLALTTNKLAHRLKAFGVKPRPNAAGDQRGYRRQAFDDVFARYLPRDPSECQTSECEQHQRRNGADSHDVSRISAGVSSDAFRRRADALAEDDKSAKHAAHSACSDGLTPSDRTHGRNAVTPWATNTKEGCQPLGGLSQSSPGQTDRVQRALARAAQPQCLE